MYITPFSVSIIFSKHEILNIKKSKFFHGMNILQITKNFKIDAQCKYFSCIKILRIHATHKNIVQITTSEIFNYFFNKVNCQHYDTPTCTLLLIKIYFENLNTVVGGYIHKNQ